MSHVCVRSLNLFVENCIREKMKENPLRWEVQWLQDCEFYEYRGMGQVEKVQDVL